MAIHVGAQPQESPLEKTRAINAADVAKLPPPGSVVPGGFGFTPDGQALTERTRRKPPLFREGGEVGFSQRVSTR